MSETQAELQKSYRRRRLLVIGAAVALLALGGGAVAVKRVVAERGYATRKAHAMQVLSAGSGDLPAAIAELKDVVQHRPKDIEAVAALARALPRQPGADRQQVIDAARYYSLLLEVDPNRPEERLELIRLLDLLGESDALAKLIVPIIEARPKDAGLRRLQTLHLARLSRLKDAELAAFRWAECAPTDFNAQWTYVSLLTQSGKDQKEPDSYLNKKAATGANPQLWALIRGVWLISSRQNEAAAALLKPLASSDTLPAELQRPLIFALIDAGCREEADRLLDAAVTQKGDSSLTLVSVLQDLDRANNTRAVQRLREMALSTNPALRGAQLCTTAFVAQRNANTALYEDARKSLDTLPVEVSATWRAVLTATAPGPLAPDVARQLMPALRASVLNEDGVPLLQLATANCLVSLKQNRLADRVLLDMSRGSIGWSIGARRLFELRRSQGQLVQAIDIARFAFSKSGHTVDSAIVLAQAVGDSKPTGAQADGLLQILRMIQQTVPGEVQTVGLYVDALAQRRDPSASSVLRDALDRNTNVPLEYLLYWAQLSQQHQLGLDEACFAKAEASYGTTPRVALSRALVQHRNGKGADALQILRAARAASSEQTRRAYDDAIAQFLLIARSPDASEAWNALAAAHPDDVGLQIKLIDLGFASTADQVRTVISRIRKVEPGNAAAELADIKLALTASSLRSAKESALLRVNRLVERAPEMIAARLAQIELLSNLNDPKAAMAQWEKSLVISPEDPNLLLAGVQLLILNGERSRATEVLQKVERLDANLSTAQRLNAAKTFLALGEVDRTVQILEPMHDLPRDSKLLLAEALFRVGRAQDGQALMSELLANPDLDTLLFAAAVEDSQGHADAANDLLLRARQITELSEADRLRMAEYASERGGLERVIGVLTGVNVSMQTTIRIAQLWLAQGNVDAAMKALSDAAAKTADAATLQKRLKDEPQLRGLIALKLNDVAAQLLETPDDLATRQMVEFVLETQKQTLKEQQTSLDRLAAMESNSYALQMFLANRFLAVNQPAAAGTHARLAAGARPGSPQPMALAALAAARTGNTGRSAQAIKEWRDRLPADSTQPDALDAQILAQRREYTELLARYEPRLVASGGRASVDVLFGVAQAMHARGRDADAITLLRPVIEADSRASILWLGHVGADVEPPSAWKSLEAFRETIQRRQLPSEQAALAIATDQVARRSRNAKWMGQGLAQLKEFEAQANLLDSDVVMKLAQNRVDRGELAEAAAIYQKAIAPRVDAAALEAKLAEVLLMAAKPEEALAAIDRALKSSSATPLMHDTRAAILEQLNRLDEALAAAQSAQHMDELNPRWLMRVASIQQSKGDLVTARPSLEILRWFFREPEAWDAQLIERFHAFEAGMSRRPSTRPEK